MIINLEKTKVMVFGDVINEVKIKINVTVLENVQSYKYLAYSVVLDQQLDFSWQVDYAVGKAKRATAKVGTFIDGTNRTRGIPVDIGIQLYKSLVRPHLEYAFPVWANIKDKDIDKLENAQLLCLRQVMEAKLYILPL